MQIESIFHKNNRLCKIANLNLGERFLHRVKDFVKSLT
jgi:hypothetical protein